MEMKVTHESDTRVVLTCSGDIGWDDHDALPQRIIAALGEVTGPQVLMDLEHVHFVNSAGLGALLQTVQVVSGRKGTVVLVNVSAPLTQMFTTAGLDRVVPIAETLDEARALLDEPA